MGDLGQHMGEVAREFWGQPNRRLSSKNELRWGHHGSRSVDLAKGTWYDHENKVGGGVVDLLRHNGVTEPSAWLTQHGFDSDGDAGESKPNGAGRSKRQLVATYDYRDETGELLFQVCRFHPKQFLQRKHDAEGNWIWSVKGVRQVLYRLPEVLEAVGNDQLIVIVEGEKDADRLVKIGICATTNPGGVGKWREEYGEALNGARVVIIPDNDDAGRKHATEVAASLTASLSVAIVQLPGLKPKGDVSDWLELGGTREDLDRLIAGEVKPDQQPHGFIDAGDMKAPGPRQWLMKGQFARGYVSSIIGAGGVGKTALRYAQYLAGACGKALTGDLVIVPFKTLVLSFEDSAEEFRRRLLAAMKFHRVEADAVRGRLFGRVLTRNDGQLFTRDADGNPALGTLSGLITRWVDETGADLVAIDPVIKAQGLDENSNVEQDMVMSELTRLAIELNIAIDVVDHVSKAARENGAEPVGGRGASAKVDALRLAYSVRTMRQEEADKLGLGEADRRKLIRVDNAKLNIAPALDDAKWFKLISVDLDNATKDYPAGDSVQTVTPYVPQKALNKIPIETVRLILDRLAKGTDDGARYSVQKQAQMLAAWRVVAVMGQVSEQEAKDVIAIWKKSGLIFDGPYQSPVHHREVWGVFVDPTKRP